MPCPDGYVFSEEFGRCITTRQAEQAVPAFYVGQAVFSLGARLGGPLGRIFSTAELLNLLMARIGGPEVFMSNQSVIAHAPGASETGNIYSYNSAGVPGGGALSGAANYAADQLDAVIAALYARGSDGAMYPMLDRQRVLWDSIGGQWMYGSGPLVPWPPFRYKGLDYAQVRTFSAANLGAVGWQTVGGHNHPRNYLLPLLSHHLVPFLKMDVFNKNGVGGKVKSETLAELLGILTSASQWRG